MSATLPLPSSSLTAANAADASDIWRVYRLAGNADSVSPSAVKALSKAARAN